LIEKQRLDGKKKKRKSTPQSLYVYLHSLVKLGIRLPPSITYLQTTKEKKSISLSNVSLSTYIMTLRDVFASGFISRLVSLSLMINMAPPDQRALTNSGIYINTMTTTITK
jgi:hypothetical protein